MKRVYRVMMGDGRWFKEWTGNGWASLRPVIVGSETEAGRFETLEGARACVSALEAFDWRSHLVATESRPTVQTVDYPRGWESL